MMEKTCKISLNQHDDAVLCEIFQAIINHPHDRKYRCINKNKTSAILHDPQTSFSILHKLGFENHSNNNHQLVYKGIKFCPREFSNMYVMNNISGKLFDLACNQLCFKEIRSESTLDQYGNVYFNNRYSHSQQGVFVYYPPNNELDLGDDELANVSVKLIKELVQLPNQYHFFGGRNKWQCIWILNNNGSMYRNINWENMDLNQLINNLSPQLFECIKAVIEYCIKNDQFTFLKKVIYFMQKAEHENIAINWPKCVYEVIMMQVKKYNKILGNHPYFVEKILKMCLKLSNNFVNNKNIPSIFSKKVEEFVKDIIPKLKNHCCKTAQQKNIQFLKEKTNWQCFLCKNINDITQDVCPNCYKNKSYYTVPQLHTNPKATQQQRPYIECLNPYQPFIENNSTLFNIKKSFGVVKHAPIVVFKSRNLMFGYFNHQNKEKTIIGVICESRGFKKFTILFHERNALTVGELKIILGEIQSTSQQTGKYNEILYCSLERHPVFKTMSDDTPIPAQRDVNGDVKYYYIDTGDGIEFNLITRIRSKYKIHFGNKHCNYQCPFMIARKKKSQLIKKDDIHCKNNENTGNIPLFQSCPYVNGKHNFDNYNSDKILDHFSSFDHFKSFNIVQPRCKYGDNTKCVHYQRVLKNDQQHTNTNINQRSFFEDRKHLFLYRHMHSPIATEIIMDKNNTIRNHKSCKFYDCTQWVHPKLLKCGIVKEMKLKWAKTSSESLNSRFLFVVQSVAELAKNGFIDELLPRKDVNPMFGNKEYILTKMKSITDEFICILRPKNMESQKQFNAKFFQFFSNTFEIFDIVNSKLNHPRHEQMGRPLSQPEMLAVILYCIDRCNHNLCQSQRDGNVDEKWPMFDFLLNRAIRLLSQFEEHWENIYTGVCGVFYKFSNNNNKISDVVYLKTNVSFTTDLNVAKQFRGASGMIIGLNMKRSYAATMRLFQACDVSWISKHVWEKEVLCSRGSQVPFYRNKMEITYSKNNDKQQWFVCDEGNLQETSYQAMFT